MTIARLSRYISPVGGGSEPPPPPPSPPPGGRRGDVIFPLCARVADRLCRNVGQACLLIVHLGALNSRFGAHQSIFAGTGFASPPGMEACAWTHSNQPRSSPTWSRPASPRPI